QKWQLLAGIVWAALIAWLAPGFFWWLTPVFVGLLFAIPLTVWTSRASLGRAARARGLFLVPEESAPPAELEFLQPSAAGHLPAHSAIEPWQAAGAHAPRRSH
ncbi:MAG TPA: hypothetical protein VL994_07300, partial [Steroidobacteraceae bacterium]|nr:hypothetical protein [Steroidobacteraceae bacterium]